MISDKYVLFGIALEGFEPLLFYSHKICAATTVITVSTVSGTNVTWTYFYLIATMKFVICQTYSYHSAYKVLSESEYLGCYLSTTLP